MINTLKASYFKSLEESFNNASVNIKEAVVGKEERALVYGNGRPIYVTSGGLSPIYGAPDNTHFNSFQKLLALYEVKPDKYEHDSLLHVEEVGGKLKISLTEPIKGTIRCSGYNGRYKTITKSTKYSVKVNQDHVVGVKKEGEDEFTNYYVTCNTNPMYSLMDLFDILIECMQEDEFYGITTSIGNQILHISHPMVLAGLLKNIPDPDEPLFDNTWLYKFKDKLSFNDIRLGTISNQYKHLRELLSSANSNEYKFDANFSDNSIEIIETYNGAIDFYATIPIQTAYSGHVSYPYYGVEHVKINESNPVGQPFWPITSPNVDTYYSWDVCTGTKVKTLEGVSMLFDGNFASTFPVSNNEGTFREGWREAIKVMITETKSILNAELGAEFDISLPVYVEPNDIELLQGKIIMAFSIGNISFWYKLAVLVKEQDFPIGQLCIDKEVAEYFIHKVEEHGEFSDGSLKDKVTGGTWLANLIIAEYNKT